MMHQPCPRCRAAGRDRKGDNLAIYGEGDAHCFSCGYHLSPKGSGKEAPIEVGDQSYEALPHRNISVETCRKYSYTSGDSTEVAHYIVNGETVAQHVRVTRPDKDFRWHGDTSKATLWGQQLFNKGRRIYITEGEIDCMSVYQTLGGMDAVVSVPNGAQSALRDLKKNLDYLQRFDEVVLVFDNDKPGRDATDKCAQLFKPGKVRVAHLQYKDPNAYLKAGKGAALVADLHNAQVYRPRDIVHVSEVKIEESENRAVYPYPWDFLTEALLGREEGEIIGIVSGSGMGKSTFVRTMIRRDLDAGYKVGVLMLEETVDQTKDELVGLSIGKPVPQILRARKVRELIPHMRTPFVDDLTDEEYRRGHEELDQFPLYMYNSSEMDPEALLARMNYMAVGLGCTHLYLDHLTIATAGGENERKDIDNLMRELREMAVRTGAVTHVVSQLTDKEGKSYEEGASISLNKMRGSRVIGHTMNSAIALERNQQEDDDEARNTSVVRVLKSRGAGITGIAGRLRYDHKTGRLEDPQQPLVLTGTIDV